MPDEEEKIVNMRIDSNGVLLFTTKMVHGYFDINLFLCEIYEKLCLHYESAQPQKEFFNYVDPEGAWVLLSDFFKKTNYLRNADLKTFEEYRARYGFSLEYKKGLNASAYAGVTDPESYMFVTRFQKELDPYRKFNKSEIDNGEFLPDVFLYNSCRTMIDFVFSIVHYLIFNGYKITHCEHCGRLFATKTLKVKYCASRLSPYSGYEQYTCKKAVKQIVDTLEKRRKTEYERLRKRAAEYGRDSTHWNTLNSFVSRCDDYKKNIKKGASVELLEEYQSFLYDSNNVRPKYERIKNW